MTWQALQNIETLYRKKITSRLREIGEAVWPGAVPVAEVAAAETMEHLTPGQAAKLKFRPVEAGWRWGQPWSTCWFRIRATVPKAFKGRTVALLFNPQGECIVFRNGEPIQGLDRNRSDCVLLRKAKGGEKIDLLVEAGASNDFGRFEVRSIDQARLAPFHPEVFAAWHDGVAAAEAADTMPEDDARRAKIFYHLNQAVDAFDYAALDDWDALTASARRLRKAVAPVYAAGANASAPTVACAGHAHIDVAWLWPLAETRRKCGRTFSNVLALMDEYPEFVFAQSQPHLYEFTREDYPSLFRQIRKKVKSGQWTPTGCMWIEADCNLTSGESLVRQVLYGTRYIRDLYGEAPDCLWLPDVFGYSAALPQILRRSGIRYFLTQKISWNQVTRFPHHSFHWEGLDGSEVLSHFPPVNTYNARLSAQELAEGAKRYRQKDRSDLQLVPFGFGDGGGGPTRDMLERRRRYENFEGMPKTVPMSPRDFFARLEVESDTFPRWVGELYLELHRGTLTSQARNKRHNRKAELGLREAEFLASVLEATVGAPYPGKDLTRAWRTVLLNQFHDIIPGSSITKVYEDSERDYAEVFATLDRLRSRGLRRYAAHVDTRGQGQPVLLINPLSWARDEVVEAAVPGLDRRRRWEAVDAEGQARPVQVGADGRARFRAAVPSLGHAAVHLRKAGKLAKAERPVEVTATPTRLENEHLRVDLDAQGRLVRVVDKDAGRDVLAEGGIGNRLQVFEDKPVNWEAWDVDIFYKEKLLEQDGALESVEVAEAGPVRGVIRIVRRISRSRVVQDLVLAARSRRLDFETSVDWDESEKQVLLKVAFPLRVRSEVARFEIQFGDVARPTHRNLPSDMSRFEVVGHKWADLSEGGYGAALLNDSKYGYDAEGDTLRLSLLRAPRHPDPKADVGQTHRFTYSLFPHAGDHRHGVVRAGYELNAPVLAAPVRAARGEWAARQSWIAADADHVVIDTVKRAEDDGAMVVRLYECHGQRGPCTLTLGVPASRVVETDLMEREEAELPVKNGKVRLEVTPYQLRTLKVVPC